jgi:dCMP deaminase
MKALKDMVSAISTWREVHDTLIPNNRLSWDELFMAITKLFSYRSACVKTKQASIIIKDNRIISTGYNGPPSGDINCMEDGGESACGKDSNGSCYLAIHAEQNAIAYAVRNGINVDGATVYCTMTPCISCAKLLVASGIKEFVYLEDYRITEGKEFLERAGVKIRKYDRI